MATAHHQYQHHHRRYVVAINVWSSKNLFDAIVTIFFVAIYRWWFDGGSRQPHGELLLLLLVSLVGPLRNDCCCCCLSCCTQQQYCYLVGILNLEINCFTMLVRNAISWCFCMLENDVLWDSAADYNTIKIVYVWRRTNNIDVETTMNYLWTIYY